MSILHPSNCAVLTLRKSDKQKKKKKKKAMRTFPLLLLLTYIPMREILCFTAFHGRDVCNAGDCIGYAWRERERNSAGVDSSGECGGTIHHRA